MSKLILHAGANTATLEQVEAVATPEATDNWQPIPHAALLGRVRETLTRGGLTVVREQHGLWRDGARYFGTLDLTNGHNQPDYGLAVGLRNSHDMSFAAGLACGSRVFVCDNLSFSAEVVFARKHTTNINRDLAQLVSRAIGELGALRVAQDTRIAAYKQLQLTDGQTHDLLIQSVDRRILPITQVPAVLDEWRTPKHEEFAPRTGWSLFNAYTEVLKASNQLELPKRTQALHGLLDVVAGVKVSTN